LDPRIRRSRLALENALWELLAERDLTQISISDITKRAEVNRSTFYEHYTDVHDLAASACTAMFDELIAATPMFGAESPTEIDPADNPLPRLFTHVAEHAHLYRTLLGPDGSARVINHLRQRIAIAFYVNRGASEDGPPTHADDPAEVPYDPEAAYVAGAILGTVVEWLRRDCPGTPEQLGVTIWRYLIGHNSVTGSPLPLKAGRRRPQ
jgi:AcrR family transcriptional regulator